MILERAIISSREHSINTHIKDFYKSIEKDAKYYINLMIKYEITKNHSVLRGYFLTIVYNLGNIMPSR